jgi:hypothetical protein
MCFIVFLPHNTTLEMAVLEKKTNVYVRMAFGFFFRGISDAHRRAPPVLTRSLLVRSPSKETTVEPLRI